MKILRRARQNAHQVIEGARRGAALALMALGVLCPALLFYKGSDYPQLLKVETPSLPPGWYALDPRQPIEVQVGQLVQWNFVPPQWLRTTHPELSIKPHLKRVAAGPGDRVYWSGQALIACTGPEQICAVVGNAIPHDGQGQRFPRARFPEVVPADHYLLIADHPLSMDGRYLGLVPITSIMGTAKPLRVESIDYADIQRQTDAFFRSNPE